jgi:hypothetical protein
VTEAGPAALACACCEQRFTGRLVVISPNYSRTQARIPGPGPVLWTSLCPVVHEAHKRVRVDSDPWTDLHRRGVH